MQSIIRKILLFSLLQTILPSVIWSQHVEDHDSSKTLETIKIVDHVHSKQAIGKTLDVVALKREQMLLAQGNTFMNTLEKLPGISAIQTGVGIAKPVIRGMSLNRVIVTEYGIKQEGQQWGVDHGLEIDQFNVERVEVIKGPMSVLYGSDGIGGVLQILPPSIPAKDTLNLELISNYKSNNNLWGGSAKVLYSTPKYYFLARTTYQDFASYKVPAEQFSYNSYALPIYNQRLKNTAGNELNLSLLTGIKRQWGNSSLYFSNFHQKAGFFVGAFGIPRAYQLVDDGNYRKVGLPYQSINHTKIVSNTNIIWHSGKLESDLGWQLNKRAELSTPHAHANGVTPSGNKALGLDLTTLSGNIRYSKLGWEKWSSTTGWAFHYQNNKSNGYEFLIPDYHSFQTGLFNFTEWKASDVLLLNGGLRFDFGKQKANATYVYQYNDQATIIDSTQRSENIDKKYWNVSGSLGVAWQFAQRQKLKFNFGTAFRMPTMAELAANGVHHGTFRHEKGNSELYAEQGLMMDLGWHLHAPKYNIVLTPFANYFTNYLYLGPSGRFSPLPEAGQIYQYNGAEAIFCGLELATDWQWAPGLANNLSMEYVWNKNLETDRPLPFTPPLSIVEEITWEPEWNSKKFVAPNFSLTGQYYAAQNRVDRNEPTTAGYFLLHVSAAQSIQFGKHKLTAYFQVRNLTNTIYQNNMSRYRILNLPEQGRNFQFMLKWNWN